LTYDEAKRLVVLALSNYPNMQDKDMKATAMLWQKLLTDLTYEQAEAALVKVLITAKFFPTVAEIREAHQSIVNAGIPSPEEAWKFAKKLSIYMRDIEYPHPLVKETVEVLGLHTLVTAEWDMSKRFMETYRSLQQRRKDKQENEAVCAITAGRVMQLGRGIG
jgi:hypothetical protein